MEVNEERQAEWGLVIISCDYMSWLRGTYYLDPVNFEGFRLVLQDQISRFT